MSQPQQEQPSVPSLPEIPKLDFDVALEALEKVVDRLEQEQVPLEEALKLFEVGEHLRKHCHAKLEDARARLQRVTIEADGTVSSVEQTAPNKNNA